MRSMFGPAAIAIACRIPKERAAFMEWLEAAGYTPVPILDLRTLSSDLENRPIEALVADADVVAQVGLGAVLRILTPNRPLVIVGKLFGCPPELRHMVSWLDRPVAMLDLTLGVALALAEGRPARRSARKTVLHLPATVDGVNSQVLDVSNEGVRLRLKNTTASTVPPYFTLRVEVFGVATLVQRAWVAHPGDHTVVCGGVIQRHLPRSRMWTHLVAMAPTPSSTPPGL
jgi:hypothetical protein